MSKAILIADDDPTIRDVLELYLRREGYAVLTAADGQTALDQALTAKPDLLVLDVMLPQLDGWEICRRVRAESALPILMLTARGEDYERITGLSLGADDYVTKPFSPGEIMARIKAIFRRIELARLPAAPAPGLLRCGPLTIDPATRQVTVQSGAGPSASAALTAKEFDLLYFLASHPGQVFTRDQLLNQVWGYAYAGETGTVAVHIHHLREKLEPDPAKPTLIETVWGVGYRFNKAD